MIARHIALALVAAAACSEARGMVDASTATSPPRPEPCVRVEPGASIQAALDDVATSAVCLDPGDHRGSLRLTRAVTLWGPRDAVLHGGAAGTIIDVTAPHAAVLGLTIDGTGGRFDMLDGAVRLAASDTRVEGVTVTNAVFGILLERASRVRVVGNRIAGSRDPATGLRGDTIRMWETRDSIIEGNTIEDGRDLVVWYSRDNRIANNRVSRARYGLHFMYSHGNTIHGNVLVDGVVGVFVMYSRDLHITDNVIANAAAQSRISRILWAPSA